MLADTTITNKDGTSTWQQTKKNAPDHLTTALARLMTGQDLPTIARVHLMTGWDEPTIVGHRLRLLTDRRCPQ